MSTVYDDDVLNQGADDDIAPDIVSFAVVTIWAYLIPNLFVEFSEYMLAASKSPTWGRDEVRLLEVQKSLRFSFFVNLSIGVILYFVCSFLVSYFTTNMDRRATYICIGFSRIFAGIIFGLISILIPQWFGTYFSHKRKVDTFKSIREIRFAQSWSLWKQLASMFFFNLYFSCRAEKFSVLYGILVGIPIGLLLFYFVYLARKLKGDKSHYKKCLAITVIIAIVFASTACIWAGIWYIVEVWLDSDASKGIIVLATILGWGLFCVAVHLVLYKWTQRKLLLGKSSRFKSEVFKQSPLMSSHISKSMSLENQDDFEKTGDSKAAENVGDTFDSSKCNIKDDTNKPSKGVAFASPEESSLEDLDDIDDNHSKATDKLEPNVPPSYCTLFAAKLYKTYPCFCCCLKKYSMQNVPESRKSLMMTPHNYNKSSYGKFFDGFSRFCWYILSFGFFYLTVVNIGATSQQDAAREALGPAFNFLYPPDYNTGEMCAWDKPGPDADIKTFSTVEEVILANYTVIHCGACGGCSSFEDLTLEWTTRKFLAEETKKCAQVSMFGSWDDVTQCNMDRVGFSRACSECWTYDEINTKDKCVFIYLQSLISNAFADFKVSFFDITSATCDEAISGPEFVPCSGATRRRMNIVSDIQRPKSQQCTVAQQNWTEIFGDPYNGIPAVEYPEQGEGK